ncbi:MAG: hypothetical protein COB66_08690 [Coxiella sp. (in: Bacteria)]|nr:MAG: hypothetical protein COB66_08690 [Coxiella sp. (in: g-proteobacteria)]
MQLPYHYHAKDDWPSTVDNNTPGFFCRADQQTPNKFSLHSYGVAIDINPRYNPALVTPKHAGDPLRIQPKSGTHYYYHHKGQRGMIEPDDAVIRIFAQHGWKWGSYWQPPDTNYMHFQKDMDSHYQAHSLERAPKDNTQ